MGGEIIVQAGGPGVHQRAQPRRAAAIIGLQLDRVDPEPLAQILPDRAFALGLGGAAQRGQQIGLDPREIVLRLGVDRAEHGIGIARAADMGDAPIVAGDGGARGEGIADRPVGVIAGAAAAQSSQRQSRHRAHRPADHAHLTPGIRRPRV